MSEIYKTSNQSNAVTGNSVLKFFPTTDDQNFESAIIAVIRATYLEWFTR